MIGVYKITSPSERIYIGSSSNIEKRFNDYRRLDCKGQTRLFESLKKYGVFKHVFEIIEECEFEMMFVRERYWQEHYNVLSKKGLNCQYVKTSEKPKIFSEETRNKISKANKGRILPRGELSPNFGRKASNKTKELLRQANLGKKQSLETIQKRRDSLKSSTRWRLVFNTETGIYYDNLSQAAEALNINRPLLYYYLTKAIKNPTSIIYVNEGNKRQSIKSIKDEAYLLLPKPEKVKIKYTISAFIVSVIMLYTMFKLFMWII